MGRLTLPNFGTRLSHPVMSLGGDLMSPHPTHFNLQNLVSEIADAHHLQSH